MNVFIQFVYTGLQEKLFIIVECYGERALSIGVDFVLRLEQIGEGIGGF